MVNIVAPDYLPEHRAPRRYLFVASTGGHLAELKRFAARMNSTADSVWVTSRTPQSESLLQDLNVLYLPYVGGRDPIGVLRAALGARVFLRGQKFDVAVSTGSAFALGIFAAAAVRRIPRIFIESVSRVRGPSLTGRIVAITRLAELRSQHSWPRTRWRPHPSVLAQYIARPRLASAETDSPSIFVTLGTFRRFRFDAAVDAVIESGLASTKTTWQLGATSRADLPGRAYFEIDSAAFDRAIRESDIVVTHAGIGTILSLLEAGVYPVVLPRRRYRDEHVDDHQIEIAELLRELKLACVVDAKHLTPEDLAVAMRMEVIPLPTMD